MQLGCASFVFQRIADVCLLTLCASILEQASHRGEKMRICRERATSDLRRLKQTIERTNRQRMGRFMELAQTHVTATEIQKQLDERQKRVTDITLELAGDLDEQGEAELRSAVNSLDAKRAQTRREVLDTFSNEAYLTNVVTKLREVTVSQISQGHVTAT